MNNVESVVNCVRPCSFVSVWPLIDNSPIIVKTCWMKTISGAWCTTVRLHPTVIWPCIFGCHGEKDELKHYILCPVLWQLVREHVPGHEQSITSCSRLCLVEPSFSKLKAFAFAHLLCHTCKNEPSCLGNDGFIKCGSVVQAFASEAGRAIKHTIQVA